MKLIREDHKQGNWKWRSHAEGQLPHSLYPPREERKIWRRVREGHHKISKEVGNLKRTIDATNMIRNMFKRPNYC